MIIPFTNKLAKSRVSQNVVTAELRFLQSQVGNDDFDAGRCRTAQGFERLGQAAVIRRERCRLESLRFI